MSSNSNIPDLETHDQGHQPPLFKPNSYTSQHPGRKLSATHQDVKQQQEKPDTVPNIQPHPEILEKKKEVLQDLAEQKQAVQEAKGFTKVPPDLLGVMLSFSFFFRVGPGIACFIALHNCSHVSPTNRQVMTRHEYRQ